MSVLKYNDNVPSSGKLVPEDRLSGLLFWYRKVLDDNRGAESHNHTDTVIHKGLSLIVCGYLIRLVQDLKQQVAQVTVVPLEEAYHGAGDERPTGNLQVDLEAVARAAVLFAQRARRFLGMRWTVQDWDLRIGSEPQMSKETG